MKITEEIEQEYKKLSEFEDKLKEQIVLLLRLIDNYRRIDQIKSIHYEQKAEEKALKLNDYQYLQKIYKFLGELHFNSLDYNKSLVFTEKSLEYARDANDNETLISGYYAKGLIYLKTNDHKKSEEFFRKALEISQQVMNPVQIAKVLTGMGILAWKQGNYELALQNYQKALQLRKEQLNAFEEATLHNYIGVIYKNQGNLVKALSEYNQSLNVFMELNDRRQISKLLNNIGNLYLMQGNNEKAIDHYLKSLKVSEELKDDHTRSSILNNIGLIFFNTDEYEKSLPYLQEALKIREKMTDRSALAHSLKNLGLAYQKTGQSEKSISCKTKALNIELELDDKAGLATTYSLIGLSYSDEKEYEKARINYIQSLKLHELLGDKPGKAVNLINLGGIHLHLGELAEAKKLVKKGLNLAKETGVVTLIKDGYNVLSEISVASKDYKKAYIYFKLSTKVKEKLENLESKRHIEDLQAKYEFDKREKEAEIYRLKNIELAEANKELTKLKENLEIQVEEGIQELRKKDTLMAAQSRQAEMGKMLGFIAHQWKQPLNAIGLIAQNLEDAYRFNELDEKTLARGTSKIFEQVKYMSKTIDDFRNFFKPASHISIFNISQVIMKTVKLISQSFDDHNIELNLDLDDDCYVEGFPNEFSQVIINLLNNARDALETAENVSSKKVWICLFKDNDKVVTEIKDNGNGLEESILTHIFEPYFSTKSDNKGTGLGLYISKTIINEKMKGELNVTIKEGTVFKIELKAATPLNDEMPF